MRSALASTASASRGAAAPSLQAPRAQRCHQVASQAPSRQRRSVQAHDAKESKAKSVDDVLAAANALLENLSAGQTPPSVQASIDELAEMGYVCDESGCVLVLPGDRDSASGPPPISKLLQGSSWSLGMLGDVSSSDDEEEATPFTAVVSGPSWSVPLKPSELGDFVGMLSQLRMMVANLSAQGQWHGSSADRPASRVKWETNHIVMKASYAQADPGFSIEITFRTDRRSVTTEWPPEVVAAVVVAVDAELGATSSGSAGRLVHSTPAAVSA